MSMNDGGGMMELAMLFFFVLCIAGGIVIVWALCGFKSSSKQHEKDNEDDNC